MRGFVAILAASITTCLMLSCMASIAFIGLKQQQSTLGVMNEASARQSAIACSEYALEQLSINSQFRRLASIQADGLQCAITEVNDDQFPRVRVRSKGFFGDMTVALVIEYDAATDSLISRQEDDGE